MTPESKPAIESHADSGVRLRADRVPSTEGKGHEHPFKGATDEDMNQAFRAIDRADFFSRKVRRGERITLTEAEQAEAEAAFNAAVKERFGDRALPDPEEQQRIDAEMIASLRERIGHGSFTPIAVDSQAIIGQKPNNTSGVEQIRALQRTLREEAQRAEASGEYAALEEAQKAQDELWRYRLTQAFGPNAVPSPEEVEKMNEELMRKWLSNSDTQRAA